MFAGTVLSAASAGFVRSFRKTTHLTLLHITQFLTHSRYFSVIATAAYFYSRISSQATLCTDPVYPEFKVDQVCRWNGFGNVDYRKFIPAPCNNPVSLITNHRSAVVCRVWKIVLQEANFDGIRFYPQCIPRFHVHITLRSCGQHTSSRHIFLIPQLQRALYGDAREPGMGELRTQTSCASCHHPNVYSAFYILSLFTLQI